MTIEEFNAIKWHAGMKVEITSGCYKGFILRVVQPDFDQQLIGCCVGEVYDEDLTIFRCENCKLIEEE